jgi:uncharacterized protein GlcG (DUF336 family)
MELSSTSRTITTAAARGLIEAAAAKATEEGKAMVIAVVGADGNLEAFERMDGAPLLSIDIAITKAWTSALKDGDALIGGIGVSGGHYSEDMVIAEAGMQGVGLTG